jgi:endonuclease/exonuclease/phosphatase family metal-dependent hydrolase
MDNTRRRAVRTRHVAAASRSTHASIPVRGAFAVCLAAAALSGCVHVPAMAVESSRALCRQSSSTSGDITWIRPTVTRDRMLLDRWCAAVGPPILEPAPPVSARPTRTLAVITWNAHVGGGNVNLLIDELKSGLLTGGDPVDSFVLLLQETYRSDRGVPVRPPSGSRGPVAILSRPEEGERRSAVDIAHDNQLAVFYVPSMRNAGMVDPVPAAEDRGNAILSTLPLSDPLAIELPFERQRRVAIAATISGTTPKGTAWTLQLASVHLDTSLALTRGGPLAARRRQADALIQAIASRSVPTVLAGDFNTWLGTHEPAVADLRQAFTGTPLNSLGTTWTGPMHAGFPLDHVFVRDVPGVRVRRLQERYGSDHYPVLALVNLDQTPETRP